MASLLRYLWVAPVSLPAAGIALLARMSGGQAMVHEGVLEASDGFLTTLLARIYPPMVISAITLGHVVLARTRADLDATRSHERVHVRQFERWGALFPFLYLGASLAALLGGRHVYHDNRFEREACRLA